MSNWKIINADCAEVIDSYINSQTVIVTDPPFNIGYHYKTYKDKMDEQQYLEKVGGW